MYRRMQKQAVVNVFFTFFSVFLLVALFMRPEVSLQGISRGLQLCVTALIPSMFPFLVLSKLLLGTGICNFLGFLLRPYTKLLRISCKEVGGAIVIGLVGGFVAGTCAVATLYDAKKISARDAEVALCVAVSAGPGFLVQSVGVCMLQSSRAGWLLCASTTLASLCCALIMARVLPQTALPLSCQNSTDVSAPTLLVAIQKSVSAMLSVCGCVVFFSFVIAVMLPHGITPFAQLLCAMPLEMTSACAYAAMLDSSNRLYLCALCISCLSASIVAQVRILTPRDTSLTPLLASRILHGIFTVLFLRLLLWGIPDATTCATHIAGNAYVQLPPACIMALFTLLALLFSATPLRKREKSI